MTDTIPTVVTATTTTVRSQCIAEVYQIQRYLPIIGWTLPVNRPHFSEVSYSMPGNTITPHGSNTHNHSHNSGKSISSTLSSFERNVLTFFSNSDASKSSLLLSSSATTVTSSTTDSNSNNSQTNQSVTSETEYFASDAPVGWEWRSNAWEVDTTHCCTGDISAEGWVYASSFDRLFDDIKAFNSNGVASTTSIVRGRKWIRTMTCISNEIEAKIQDKIADITLKLSKYGKLHDDSRSIIESVKLYENKRCPSYAEMHQVQSRKINNALNELKLACNRLIKLKQYAIDRATVEMTYAKALQSLSNTYCSVDIIATNSNSNRGSLAIDSSYIIVDTESVSSSIYGLTVKDKHSTRDAAFNQIDDVHTFLSSKVIEFSTVLSDTIANDLEAIIREASDAYHIYKGDVNKYSRDVKVANDITKKCYNSIDAIYQGLSHKIVSQIADLSDNLVVAKGAKRISVAYNDNSGSNNGNDSTSNSNNSSSSNSNGNTNSNTGGDFWLSIQRYKRAVFMSNACIQTYIVKMKEIIQMQTLLMIKIDSIYNKVRTSIATQQTSVIQELYTTIPSIYSTDTTAITRATHDSAGNDGNDDDGILAIAESLQHPCILSPKIIIKSSMLVTSAAALKRSTNYRSGVKWLEVHVLITSDDYLHIMSNRATDMLPSKSMYLKACSIGNATDAHGYIPNAIDITPIQESVIGLLIGSHILSDSNISLHTHQSSPSDREGIVLYNTDISVIKKWLIALKGDPIALYDTIQFEQDDIADVSVAGNVMPIDNYVVEATSSSGHNPIDDGDAAQELQCRSRADVDDFLSIISNVDTTTDCSSDSMAQELVSTQLEAAASDVAAAVPLSGEDDVDSPTKALSVRDRASFFKSPMKEDKNTFASPKGSVEKSFSSSRKKSVTIAQYEDAVVKSKVEHEEKVLSVKEEREKEVISQLNDVDVDVVAKKRFSMKSNTTSSL